MLDGGRGDDLLIGNVGNDVLSGGHDADMILGGAGNDRIHSAVGTGDEDIVPAGDGHDVIRAHDRSCDRISCGAGRSRLRADHLDAVANDWEIVTRR